MSLSRPTAATGVKWIAACDTRAKSTRLRTATVNTTPNWRYALVSSRPPWLRRGLKCMGLFCDDSVPTAELQLILIILVALKEVFGSALCNGSGARSGSGILELYNRSTEDPIESAQFFKCRL